MNTKNNKRRRESVEKIEKALVQLLQTTELKKISIADICKETGLNRSTFYANFIDIYDLADKLRSKLEMKFSQLFADYDYFNERSGALKMFEHMKENQLFYTGRQNTGSRVKTDFSCQTLQALHGGSRQCRNA